MKSIFLLCALALPPMPRDKEWRMMTSFFKRYYPDYQVILIHPEEVMVGLQWYATPMRFKGYQIWLAKRAA